MLGTRNYINNDLKIIIIVQLRILTFLHYVIIDVHTSWEPFHRSSSSIISDLSLLEKDLLCSSTDRASFLSFLSN